MRRLLGNKLDYAGKVIGHLRLAEIVYVDDAHLMLGPHCKTGITLGGFETAIGYCVTAVGTGTRLAGTVAVQLVAVPHTQGTAVPLKVQVVVGVKPVPVNVSVSDLLHVLPSCEKPLAVT